MMHDWGFGFFDGWSGWLGWLGPILMAVFWASVVVGIVFLVRWLVRRSSPPEKQESALDILNKRYAAGEIGSEEFARMKKDLLQQ